MPTPESCRLCSKPLTALADQSGLCEECLRTTDRTAPTVPEELPTVTAAVSPTDATASFAHSHGTHSLRTDDPEPLVVSARLHRLRELGWLDVRRICNGGMGELFTGYDPGLQLQLVAKFIRPEAISESTRNRFRVEAATLARLTHTNVARLFTYAEGDDPYLVTEFVSGGSLAERLRAAVLSALDAAGILEGVARGVAAAHADGVIHRDLKPSNILLDWVGATVVPKVTDFGIAKDIAALESLTQAHAVLGTPEYMSPEQARSESADCDARSDVWGLAATLYSAVTGQPPFTRNLLNPPVLREPLTPPESLTPTLHPDLSAVITKGLEKHPNDRYQTATEFADDLKRFQHGEPVLARRRAWPVRAWRKVQRLPKVATVAVLLTFATTVALGAVLRREPNPALVTPREHPDVADQRRIEYLLGELKKGNPATFVGEKGMPPYHRPVGGLLAAGTREIAGGAPVVQTSHTAFFQLTPDLPIDRYDLRMELCDIASDPSDPNGPAIHWLGVVVGLFDVPQAKGVATGGFAVWYRDSDRERLAGRKTRNELARFGHYIQVERPGLVAETGTMWKASSPEFVPSRFGNEIGKWRPLRFSVSPERLIAYWTDDAGMEKTYVDFDAAKLKTISGEHAEDFGVQLPEWSPRRPFAVLCTRAVVGIRNVTVVPRRVPPTPGMIP